MAVTGNVAIGNEEYRKKYGFGLFEVLFVNGTNEQLKAAGFNVKEEDIDAERNFITEREGVDSVRLEFACKEVTSKGNPLLRKISFFIENKERESGTNPGSFQWINNQGTCSYDGGKGIDGLQAWFKEEKDVRKALNGEEQFMTFMRNCMAVNFREGGTLAYNVKKFFKGDFRELQADLKSDYLSTIIIALTIKEKDVLDEESGVTVKKEYENFYNKEFAPGSSWKTVLNKKEWTEDDVQKILDKGQRIEEIRAYNRAHPQDKKKMEYFTAIEKLIATMADPQYPCKDRHFFGLLKEYDASTDFVGSGKVVSSDDADY